MMYSGSGATLGGGTHSGPTEWLCTVREKREHWNAVRQWPIAKVGPAEIEKGMSFGIITSLEYLQKSIPPAYDLRTSSPVDWFHLHCGFFPPGFLLRLILRTPIEISYSALAASSNCSLS